MIKVGMISLRLWKVKKELFVLLLSGIMTGCAISPVARQKQTGLASQETVESRPETSLEKDAYSMALDKSRQNEMRDDLSNVFQEQGRIILKGSDIKNINTFKVSSNGTMFITDFERRKVEMFDKTGVFSHVIGESGNGPGRHLWPSDVCLLESARLAIPDFQSHRVNIFSLEGIFLSSFTYTPQKFSAQRLLYNDETHDFYLYGNRWINDDKGQLLGATLVHNYSEHGEFKSSYLDFPDWARKLDLYSHDFPAATIESGKVYIALPFEYKIYQLNGDGNLTTILADNNSTFIAPRSGLEKKATANAIEAARNIQNWQTTWTPIKSLVVIGDKLFLQYQTFNPLRYTIDIWSLRTKNKLRTIKTNRILLAKGQDGFVYFLENSETREQTEYAILRTQVKP